MAGFLLISDFQPSVANDETSMKKQDDFDYYRIHEQLRARTIDVFPAKEAGDTKRMLKGSKSSKSAKSSKSSKKSVTTPPHSGPSTVPPTTEPPEEEEAAPPLDIEVQNDLVTCISVIDENDGHTPTTQWSDFREAFPERPVCILRPVPQPYYDLGIPTDFFDDTLNIFAEVTREGEDASDTSDWFDICEIDASRQAGITNVILFVDDSGSMRVSHVRNALDLFLERVTASGMVIIDAVYNSNEDFISPCHQTVLSR
eukprot:Nitzschia sp. Nitz4//scaffold16_size188269//44991//45761//NITZ4_001781-RA/size188269-processed-gene-0.7-mRNA-1//1//CDS//3329538487//5650//frame0